MPSVSNAKYGAQSLSQLMQVLQQVAQRAGQVRDNYAPQQATAAAPQTPFQGLMAGVIGEHNRRREEAKSQDDAAIQQSLAILDAIPDSPENTPKKLQLLTSILHPKTQRGWKEVWNPQADHTAQAQFLGKFAELLPNESEVAQQQGEAPASRVRSVAEQGAGYVPPSGKFQFPSEGKYQPLGIITDPDTGERYVQLYDQKTGEIHEKPIRRGSTEKENIATIRSSGKATASDPTRRQEASIARALAANEGLDLDAVGEDDPIMKAYTLRARQMIARVKESQASSVELGVPYKQAKTAEALANAGRGGVTGGQAATILRQDTQDQLRAKEDVTKFEAELGKFQTEMNGIWNGWKNSPYAKKKVNGQLVAVPDGELETYMKLFDPDGYARYNKLKAEVTSAKTSLQGAQERAKVVGKATPRGGGQQLDLDRVLRQEQSTPTADTQYVQHDYYIDDESTPPPDAPIRSLARVYGDPKIFLLNPQGFGIKPGAVTKGQTITTERGMFLVLSISSDGSKILVRRK